MKIAIAPAGTLGDIRPCAAFAKNLIKRGHSAVMLVPENGIFICEQYGIPYHTVKIDFDRFANDSKGQRTKSQQKKLIQVIIDRQFEDLLEPLRDCDLLIGASLQMAGAHLAEYLGIPYYHVYFTTRFLESSDFPPFRFSIESKGKFRNTLMWRFYIKFSDKMISPMINMHREKLGLQPVRPSSLYTNNILVASDPVLDPPSITIKAEYRQTGYWHFTDETAADLSCLEGIDSNRKVIYFGFGSTPYSSSSETVAILEQLVNSLNVLFVVPQKLLSDTPSTSDKIIPIGYVPHLQLFPLMDIIIHHGGAGTTHAAAQCGIPQLILPQMSDQHYWEYRVKELQISPSFSTSQEVTFENLKRGIEEILNNPAHKNAAKALNLFEEQESIDRTLEYLNI